MTGRSRKRSCLSKKMRSRSILRGGPAGSAEYLAANATGHGYSCDEIPWAVRADAECGTGGTAVNSLLRFSFAVALQRGFWVVFVLSVATLVMIGFLRDVPMAGSTQDPPTIS